MSAEPISRNPFRVNQPGVRATPTPSPAPSLQVQAIRARAAYETNRIRARAIVRVIDHLVKTAGEQSAESNGQDLKTNRVLVFTDSTSFGYSPLGGPLRSIVPEKVSVVEAPYERLRSFSTKPGDVVIVELIDPTDKELQQAKSELQSRWKGAKYRGILSGPDQKSPEEIGKPISRRIVPGFSEIAKATRQETNLPEMPTTPNSFGR